jgi:malonyl-CoA/methylmalonyl-CoA synthetase
LLNALEICISSKAEQITTVSDHQNPDIRSSLTKIPPGIRFWHFKIPVLELEERLIQLPYISEAYVLPVLDHEAQGLAAALVRLRGPHETLQNINLRRIRGNLASNMELYKLPALLYILKDGEEVPKSASEKVMKARALEKYFHLSDYRPRDYAVDGVEFWGNQTQISSTRKAWDWEGED